MGKEITPAEEKARADGWVPKEEWIEAGNEAAAWVDHGEFNFRGELMDRIKTQTKSIRSRDADLDRLGKAIKELGDHNRKIAEVEYKRALRELKQQKLVAAKQEDHEAVLEIEDQIDELKSSVSEASSVVNEPANGGESTAPREFVDWVENASNSWYMKDIALQGAANAIVADYQSNNPEASPSETLSYMEKKIKEEFPHKFSTNKKVVPKVTEPDSAGGGSSSKKSSNYTKADLSEEQLEMAKTFEFQGALSIQEYVDQLADMGELPSQQR